MNIFEKIKAAFTVSFQWWYILDIFLLILMSYFVLAFLRRHNMMPLLKYLLLALTVLGVIMGLANNLIVSAVIASVAASSVVVLAGISFQSEMRRGLFRLASPKKEADHYYSNYDCSDEELSDSITEMVRGCVSLAKNNVGALIVLQHNNMPQHIIDSGTALGSVVSAPLLECLFNTKAPLHDGAVVIEGNKIVAAGCFLPLTQSITLPKELGTRHRAGIGITENVDVLAIIVSEETGVISIAKNGILSRYYDASMLTQAMEQYFGLKVSQPPQRKRRG